MSIIGIDLGTTNSVAAVFRDGQPKVVPNALGEVLTPSVVGVDDSGQLIVGQPARDRLVTHPELTAAVFKRTMGSDKVYPLGRRKFRSEELSAMVLRSLKTDCEAWLEAPITEAIISVPAYFNDDQRKATQVAGELAGMKVERLINEPTAAALAYGLHGGDECTIAVLDLGGGTFDISILEIFEGIMEVHASAGDNRLGGEDFLDLLVERFRRSAGLGEADPHTAARIRAACERAKVALSTEPEVDVEAIIGGRSRVDPINRDTFEHLAEPLLERMRRPVEKAVRDARISLDGISNVVLVGGATRMPMVRKLASRLFGCFPLQTLNPDEVVAMGAAIQAALKARDRAVKDVVLTDVSPYSLGIEVATRVGDGNFVPNQFLPIIERNTTVPVSREKYVTTVKNGQREVWIDVYQGESRLVSNNIRLGRLKVRVPKDAAGQQSIGVRFSYDINGLLEVEALVRSTEKRHSLVIERERGAMSETDIQASIRRLEELKVHPREELPNAATLSRGERLFEELLGEQRTQVAELLAQFEAILESQDSDLIDQAREQLTRAFDHLDHRFR